MSCASPRTPCSGPNRRAGRTPAAIRRSTTWVRSAATLAGWQRTPTRRPRSRSSRSSHSTSRPVRTATKTPYTNGAHPRLPARPLPEGEAVGQAAPLSCSLVDGDRLQRDLVALRVHLEANEPALPLLLQPALDEAQLGGEGLDGDPLGGLPLALQRRDVLVEDARVVDGLALLRQ